MFEALSFLNSGLDVEEMVEYADHGKKLIGRITGDQSAAGWELFRATHLSMSDKKAVSNA